MDQPTFAARCDHYTYFVSAAASPTDYVLFVHVAHQLKQELTSHKLQSLVESILSADSTLLDTPILIVLDAVDVCLYCWLSCLSQACKQCRLRFSLVFDD